MVAVSLKKKKKKKKEETEDIEKQRRAKKQLAEDQDDVLARGIDFGIRKQADPKAVKQNGDKAIDGGLLVLSFPKHALILMV